MNTNMSAEHEWRRTFSTFRRAGSIRLAVEDTKASNTAAEFKRLKRVSKRWSAGKTKGL